MVPSPWGSFSLNTAITTITSIVSYIAMAILGISGNYLAVADGTVLNLGEYLWKLILFSLVWSLILSVILYVVTTCDEPEAEPALGSRLPAKD